MEHAATREDEPVRSTGRVEHRQFQIAIKGRCDDRLPIGLNCIATTFGLSRLIHGTNPYSRQRIIQPNGMTFNSGKVRRTKRRQSIRGRPKHHCCPRMSTEKRIRVDRDQIRGRECAVSFGAHDRIIRSYRASVPVLRGLQERFVSLGRLVRRGRRCNSAASFGKPDKPGGRRDYKSYLRQGRGRSRISRQVLQRDFRALIAL